MAISKEQEAKDGGGLCREDVQEPGADSHGLSRADRSPTSRDLRRRLREVDGVFQVVKNTLFARALEEAGIPFPTEHMEGPVAVGYCLGEVPPVAKTLVDFAKEKRSPEGHEERFWAPTCSMRKESRVWRIFRHARSCWPSCWALCRGR